VCGFVRVASKTPTHSRFADNAHTDWIPCVDQPASRTPLDFYIESLSTHTVLANGVVVDDVDDNIVGVEGEGRSVRHWHLEFPCPSCK
jgi:aminopeptidase N